MLKVVSDGMGSLFIPGPLKVLVGWKKQWAGARPQPVQTPKQGPCPTGTAALRSRRPPSKP